MTQPPRPEKDLDNIPYIIMPGAFGSEPKTVPLVQYDKYGVREVLGEATIHPDGRIDCKFDQSENMIPPDKVMSTDIGQPKTIFEGTFAEIKQWFQDNPPKEHSMLRICLGETYEVITIWEYFYMYN